MKLRGCLKEQGLGVCKPSTTSTTSTTSTSSSSTTLTSSSSSPGSAPPSPASQAQPASQGSNWAAGGSSGPVLAPALASPVVGGSPLELEPSIPPVVCVTGSQSTTAAQAWSQHRAPSAQSSVRAQGSPSAWVSPVLGDHQLVGLCDNIQPVPRSNTRTFPVIASAAGNVSTVSPTSSCSPPTPSPKPTATPKRPRRPRPRAHGHRPRPRCARRRQAARRQARRSRARYQRVAHRRPGPARAASSASRGQAAIGLRSPAA